jgi:hypothetical protein
MVGGVSSPSGLPAELDNDGNLKLDQFLQGREVPPPKVILKMSLGRMQEQLCPAWKPVVQCVSLAMVPTRHWFDRQGATAIQLEPIVLWKASIVSTPMGEWDSCALI